MHTTTTDFIRSEGGSMHRLNGHAPDCYLPSHPSLSLSRRSMLCKTQPRYLHPHPMPVAKARPASPPSELTASLPPNLPISPLAPLLRLNLSGPLPILSVAYPKQTAPAQLRPRKWEPRSFRLLALPRPL